MNAVTFSAILKTVKPAGKWTQICRHTAFREIFHVRNLLCRRYKVVYLVRGMPPRCPQSNWKYTPSNKGKTDATGTAIDRTGCRSYLDSCALRLHPECGHICNVVAKSTELIKGKQCQISARKRFRNSASSRRPFWPNRRYTTRATIQIAR